MNKKALATKLKEFPQNPGVYFHKDSSGEIIYVGKAANLRNRVRSYFNSKNRQDIKTRALVEEIADIDYLEVGSEVEALFLESAMIKRYQPKYNILLRDDKSFLYIKISNDEYPVISYTRRPMDDKSEYFGPFTASFAVKKAMKQLRKSFPYVTHKQMPQRACLHYHIGLCPGPEVGGITPQEYRKNISQLKRYLSGKGQAVIKDLEKDMKIAAKNKNYELAAKLRDQLNNLLSLQRQHLFSQEELFDLSRDQALIDLQNLLNLKQIPRRIECYDISHTQGTNNVASMVVFSSGVPDRSEYRKFKMRLLGNDDYAHMQEVITRRLKYWDKWPNPDVLVIDGGKGQVRAAAKAIKTTTIDVPVIGLAKRYEEIVIPESSQDDQGDSFKILRLDRTSHLLKLLQHIRDEAHRFAVTYHSQLRLKSQTQSTLEQIPGVGPATRKKLIRAFGSYKGVESASVDELSAVVGKSLARNIKENI
ncbi:MAG: excinuclease ABC subunit UvrC [Candidatus Saccharimonadales bacterium]